MTCALVAGTTNRQLADEISAVAGIPLTPVATERFDDGELHVELAETVRGADVYVLQPTSPPVDASLIELLFIGDACRRDGAATITAVLPYFGYARQDRRARGREPVGAAIIAALIEAIHFDRVIALDLHSPQLEGFFRVPVQHLSAAPLLAEAVTPQRDRVIVAPDLGAVKLARRYQATLHAPMALIHKTRVSGSEVSVTNVIGDVRDRAPLIVDDMISTAATIEAAVNALLQAGCKRELAVAATHGLFVGPALTRLRALPISELITTNSVPSQPGMPPSHRIVSIASLVAGALR